MTLLAQIKLKTLRLRLQHIFDEHQAPDSIALSALCIAVPIKMLEQLKLKKILIMISSHSSSISPLNSIHLKTSLIINNAKDTL